ncbi:MAG: hypothetical protein WC782_09740 [Methylococcaceae bacterium]|jgi:hypothetical protein
MSEVQEKDNFWLYIGGLIALVVILVFLLKGRETEHLQSGAVAQSNAEVFQKIDSKKTNRTTGQ